MKLGKLIERLRRIAAKHPDAEIRFETLEYGGNTVTRRAVEIVGVDYGKSGSDYCMMSIADTISAEQLRRLRNTA